jgi:hypothetical protein
MPWTTGFHALLRRWTINPLMVNTLDNHCDYKDSTSSNHHQACGKAKSIRYPGVYLPFSKAQAYDFPHWAVTAQVSNHLGRDHNESASSLCHLVTPPYWKTKPQALIQLPPYAFRCNSAFLLNHSLLSSYSLWDFCCTWGSILIPAKVLRSICNTPLVIESCFQMHFGYVLKCTLVYQFTGLPHA